MLKIWLVTIGEPISTDYSNVRLHRTGILSRYFLDHGHQIVWWNSAFDHQQRNLRVSKTTNLKVSDQENIILSFGGGYEKNVSIQRLLDHSRVAKEFRKFSSDLMRPDIIIASFPPIELCEEAVKFGKRNNVPVIIDYRDLWPEAFINLIPIKIRTLGRFFFIFTNLRIKRIFQQATGIIGITEPFLQIGLTKANRVRNSFDGVFPMGYPKQEYPKEIINEALDFWKAKKIELAFNGLRICLFGNIAKRNLRLREVIEAAQILIKLSINVQFVICGKGDGLEGYKILARNINTIHFPGFVNAIQIFSLMKISNLGILPYSPTIDFNNSLPNKAIEYFSGGLPIITSLSGYLGSLITEKDCGLIYETKNPKDLVEKICFVYKNREILKKMSENARTLYENELSADLVYNAYVKFIENVSFLRGKS